ncbi:MAG: glycoside hydrolase [Gemmatimonadetes bacterium]|nr:glycoside hydrolase [Gemmatimonadota bacterium]
MPEVVPTHALRGLLLHDARFCEANRISATSQADPFYGTPAPQAAELARLEAWSGATDAAGGSAGSGYSEVWVEASRAGTAQPGQGAGQIRWSPGDPAASSQRGWMPPRVAQDFQWLRFESATLTYHQPHALSLSDGSLLVAYVREVSGATTTIRCIRAAPESTPGSEVEIAADTYLEYSSTFDMGPQLVELPDGRVLCFYLSRRNSMLRMNVAMTSDLGTTWTRVVYEAGGIALAVAGCAGLRVVYHGGYLTCLIQMAANQCYHYVSADMGASWSLIAGDDPVNMTGASLLSLPGGGCAVIYAHTGNTHLHYTVKPSAYSGFDTDGAVVVNASSAQNIAVDLDNNRAYIAACIDQDGSIVCAYRVSGAAPGCRMRLIRFLPTISDSVTSGFSTDLLWTDTESAGGTYDAEPLTWSDDAERMIAVTLAPHTGGLRLISGFEGSAGVKTGSLGMVTLGGWSTAFASPATFGMYNDATQYGIAYVPFILASSVAGWTRTGASVSTLTSSGMQQSFAGAATDYYSVTGGASGYLWALFTHIHTSGGALTADDSFVEALCTDGATKEHYIKIRFTDTSARCMDMNNAGATLGTNLTGLTAGAQYQWQIHMNLDKVRVWYKLRTATEWILWQEVTPTSATVAAAAVFRFGTNSTNSCNATWAFVGVSHYNDPTAIAHSVIADEYLTGRPLGTQPVYVAAGASVRATRAPVMGGDLWQIALRHGYGADALDPVISPSPRRPWRSTATTEQSIVWDLGVTSSLLSPAVGLHLSRPLARTVYLEGSADNITYTTLITLDCAGAMSGLTFSRTGDILTRNGGTTGADWVGTDELVGGYALMSSGGTDYIREILGNAEGVWATPAKKMKIRIADSGTAPASGTLAILRPAVTGIAWAATTEYRYWRLRVAAQTMDAGSPGYLSIGAAVIGPLLAFGRQYSRGRTLATQHAQEITTLPSGHRSVRTLAPPRRAVEFAWAEGVDTTQAQADISASGAPDWIAGAASAEPLATRNAGDVIEGMARRQGGAALPVVYLPDLTFLDAGTTVGRRDQQVYGRIVTNTFSRVAALGAESRDEVQTVGTVRIEEEV